MAFKKLVLLAAASLIANVAWADNVYYVGFEDSVRGDYDYNDLVFSLQGDGVTLVTSTGELFSQPVLGTNGEPFWNRASGDGPKDNVGYCIYGGGNCSSGLAPSDKYLASADGVSPVNDVYFSVTNRGSVSSPISIHLAADTNLIGWYLISDPSVIHWINSSNQQTGNFSFDPTGAFGLVGNNDGGHGGDTFYSQTSVGGTSDRFGSHFAFFGNSIDPPNPVPEPGSVILLGSALLGLSLLLRRRYNADGK